MGLDFIQTFMRIEEEFDRTVDFDAVAEGLDDLPDILQLTAGDLLDMVLNHPRCGHCRQRLADPEPGVPCPACGTPFADPMPTAWDKLRGILAEVASAANREVDPARITRSTRLREDLEMG